MEPVRIVFVCLGNICRSPLAEAVLRHKAEARGVSARVHVESRGVGAWHVGEPADGRMQACASEHGVAMDGVAELFESLDYEDFHLVLAMDRDRLKDLQRRAPAHLRDRIRLFRDFDPEGGGDVPDPYYGGASGFEEVFEIVDRTSEALLDRVLAEGSAWTRPR